VGGIRSCKNVSYRAVQ